MLMDLRYLVGTIFFIVKCSYAEEVSSHVGLTESRELISARGVLQSNNSPTILYLVGLAGSSSIGSTIENLFEDYAQELSLIHI